MVLTADAGNSHTVFGVWQNDELIHSCRVATHRAATADEWHWLLKAWLKDLVPTSQVNSAVYCSVVPAINNALEEAFQLSGIKEIQQITPESNLPFTFDYANYASLGSDRIANAIAGIRYYGNDLIIADFGTAITFCLITGGVYRGGVIAPGIHSSLGALFSKTAKLPEITFRQKESVLGKSTVESIESGAYFGWRGLIKEILSELRNCEDAKRAPELKVIATGGIAENLGFSHELFDVVDRNLTLKGLYAARGL